MLKKILHELVSNASQPSLKQLGFVESRKNVLHVGCGEYHPLKLPRAEFPEEVWNEVRLDIDSGVRPNVVASITSMPMVRDESCEAVYSSHNLEHLDAHEVPLALTEFIRVLKPGGFLLLFVPDMQVVAKLVVEDKIEDTAYVSSEGPITPHDMIYGFGRDLAKGNHFMAHRSGFTASSLRRKLQDCGFVDIDVQRDSTGYGLRAIGYRKGQTASSPA